MVKSIRFFEERTETNDKVYALAIPLQNGEYEITLYKDNSNPLIGKQLSRLLKSDEEIATINIKPNNKGDWQKQAIYWVKSMIDLFFMSVLVDDDDVDVDDIDDEETIYELLDTEERQRPYHYTYGTEGDESLDLGYYKDGWRPMEDDIDNFFE